MKRTIAAIAAIALAATLSISSGTSGKSFAATTYTGDEFTGLQVDTSQWGIYDGYQASSGETWSNSRVVENSDTLILSAGGNGQIPGLAYLHDQTYGTWDVRAIFTAPASVCLNPVFLLWPQNDATWPAAGEIDFTENYDATRQSTQGFLHYGASNSQTSGQVAIDMTKWHDYSVSWHPGAVTYSIDGKQWFSDTVASHIPTGPMHLTMQINNNCAVPKTGHPYTAAMIDYVRITA
jgi:beta-glucanase (GH16 family)